MKHFAILSVVFAIASGAFLQGTGSALSARRLRSSLILVHNNVIKLDEEAKLALREEILRSGKYNPDESIFSFAKERGLIHAAPESYIMEGLQKNSMGATVVMPRE